MEKFNIDGQEYTKEELGEENLATLRSLQWVTAEIQRHEATIAAYKTAQNTYARVLKGAISKTDSDRSEIEEIEDFGENIEF